MRHDYQFYTTDVCHCLYSRTRLKKNLLDESEVSLFWADFFFTSIQTWDILFLLFASVLYRIIIHSPHLSRFEKKIHTVAVFLSTSSPGVLHLIIHFPRRRYIYFRHCVSHKDAKILAEVTCLVLILPNSPNVIIDFPCLIRRLSRDVQSCAGLMLAGAGLFAEIDGAWSYINPGTWKRLVYKLEGNLDINSDDYRSRSSSPFLRAEARNTRCRLMIARCNISYFSYTNVY